MTAPLSTRFWAKVIKTDGCWRWTGAKHSFGYGMIAPGGGREKITASRASWLIHFGEIPAGMLVCHKCDNPECTNPDHLFLGTHADNNEDRWDKGRDSRFTQAECDAIHTLLKLGASKRSLGRAFRCFRTSIESAVERGNMLPPIEGRPRVKQRRLPVPPPVMAGEKNVHAKLVAADVLRIREMRAQGLSIGDISKKFAVGKSMVSHICTRRCWTHI